MKKEALTKLAMMEGVGKFRQRRKFSEAHDEGGRNEMFCS